MMILEACNASASLDIDGATNKFRDLSLSSFPWENVSDLATTALKLIKIMDGAYAMPVNIGSTLIRKVSTSSCQYFNRTIFGHLDKARQMESMYKIKNPMLLKADHLYSRYGPIGICGLLQDEYSKLFAEHEWPALAPIIPSNVEANAGKVIGDSKKKGACFECGSTDHYRDTCPKLNRQKGGETTTTTPIITLQIKIGSILLRWMRRLY